MAVMLNELRYRNYWVTRLGALHACMEYLGKKDSAAWLYGATGHAFILNMYDDACLSGPTAWNCEMITNLAHNLGVSVQIINGWRTDRDIVQKRKAAWECVKVALDKALPCYGWELGVAEFYTICGYNEYGYYYKGIGTPADDDYARPSDGYKPWEELAADSSVGWLHVGWLSEGAASDDATTVLESLEFALEFSTSPSKWISQGYRANLDGYDNWLTALRSPELKDTTGLAYNGEVWAECRHFAVMYLEEAAARIGGEAGRLLLAAAAPYRETAAALDSFKGLFPFFGRYPEMLKEEGRRKDAARALEEAKRAESAGLDALRAVHRVMDLSNVR